jgi:hypothetical protein
MSWATQRTWLRGELVDGVDELGVDVEGAGHVEHALELRLVDHAVEEGDHRQHACDVGAQFVVAGERVDEVDRRDAVRESRSRSWSLPKTIRRAPVMARRSAADSGNAPPAVAVVKAARAMASACSDVAAEIAASSSHGAG